MDLERELAKLVDAKKTERCFVCQGKLQYVGSGKYRCVSCGAMKQDEYGIIRQYLEENGPTPGGILCRETGINAETVNSYLKNGMVEIAEGSRFYLSCEICGCKIRYGRYCPGCAKEEMRNGSRFSAQEIGEKPRERQDYSISGKMHFIGRREK